MRAWLAGLVVLLLTACAEPLPRPVEGQTLGPPLAGFAAAGRISLRQGQRSDHLKFDWRHAPGHDAVLFSSPLGQGLAEMGRDAGGAWLRVPGAAERRAADLSGLAQEVFGAPLPLEALAEWLRGARPASGGDVDGWRIDVIESAPYRERRLPRRIEVRRDDIELKIVIDGWDDSE